MTKLFLNNLLQEDNRPVKSPEQPAVALTSPGVMETSVDASHEDNNPETDVATDHQIPTEVGFMLEQ